MLGMCPCALKNGNSKCEGRKPNDLDSVDGPVRRDEGGGERLVALLLCRIL